MHLWNNIPALAVHLHCLITLPLIHRWDRSCDEALLKGAQKYGANADGRLIAEFVLVDEDLPLSKKVALDTAAAGRALLADGPLARPAGEPAASTAAALHIVIPKTGHLIPRNYAFGEVGIAVQELAGKPPLPSDLSQLRIDRIVDIHQERAVRTLADVAGGRGADAVKVAALGGVPALTELFLVKWEGRGTDLAQWYSKEEIKVVQCAQLRLDQLPPLTKSVCLKLCL